MISIEGPKYCGKTWAGRYHSNSEVLWHKATGEVDLRNLAKIIIRGGWPANLNY